MSSSLRVAIVGRPNVGKSTLVNRLAGRRTAIVEERAGVTRDAKAVEVEWAGRSFEVVDTGGWMPGGTALDEKVSRVSEKAMDDADVVIFLVDGTVGVTEEDAKAAELLRRKHKPVRLIVNKIDDPKREHLIWEFMELGLGEPSPMSALHGNGAADLLDDLVAMLPPEDEEEEFESAADGGEIAVSIVGRPNVGKSTLFNRLTGAENSIVHDMPGTTRDTIDTVVETSEGAIRFVDTAGMRRRSKVDDGTEYYSVVRALQAVDKADIAILVIDATEGVTAQDQRLAERVDLAGCPVIVLLNKWEVATDDDKERVTYQIADKLHFIGDSPVLQVSALTGKGVHRLLPGARIGDPGLRDPHPDAPGQRRHPPGAAGPAGAARRPGALRPAGGGEPADVHDLREPRAAEDLRALSGAQPAGGLRPRRHPAQAPCPQAGLSPGARVLG